MLILDSGTQALAGLALDAAALRHAAIADNVANAATPGHQRQRVNFEGQLAGARQALAAGSRVEASALSGVQPFLEPAAGVRGAAALDMEMARLAQNTLHYQALLRALGRLGTITATAVNEGRR